MARPYTKISRDEMAGDGANDWNAVSGILGELRGSFSVSSYDPIHVSNDIVDIFTFPGRDLLVTLDGRQDVGVFGHEQRNVEISRDIFPNAIIVTVKYLHRSIIVIGALCGWYFQKCSVPIIRYQLP